MMPAGAAMSLSPSHGSGQSAETTKAEPSIYDPNLGFCLFRIPNNGIRVIWQVTNSCNYGCRYCIFASNGRAQPGELTPERALAVIDELAAAGVTHVKFTGGEPLLRPDMLDLIERGAAHGLKMDLSTNASGVDDRVAARIAATGLEMVHVSLDGPSRPVQEMVRGKRTWSPTIGGIHNLVRHGAKVRIGCVIHLGNQDLLGDIAEVCADLGAAEVIFSLMEPVGRMRGRPALVSDLSNAEIRERIQEATSRTRGRIRVSSSLGEASQASGCGTCPGGSRFLFIDNLGRVSPCTWVSERRPDMVDGATLKEKSLAELLVAPGMTRYRSVANAMSRAQFGGCPMKDLEATATAERVIAEVELIDRDGERPRFGPGAPIYTFSTENIAYVSHLVQPNDAVLAVGGSGDQAIEAAVAGAASVAAFDINPGAERYADLKLAGLRYLDAEGFQALFMEEGAAPSRKTYERLREALPFGTRLFWDRIFGAASPAEAAAAWSKLFFPCPGTSTWRRFVPYLRSHATYAAARLLVARTEITWTTASAEHVAHINAVTAPRCGWDCVLLSNLADHSHRLYPGDRHAEEFRDRIILPLLQHLAPGGRLMVGYVYDADNRHDSHLRNRFNDPAVRRELYASLPGFEYREVRFESALNDGGEDAVAWLVSMGTSHG